MFQRAADGMVMVSGGLPSLMADSWTLRLFHHNNTTPPMKGFE
jgi:hypothetical protein